MFPSPAGGKLIMCVDISYDAADKVVSQHLTSDTEYMHVM